MVQAFLILEFLQYSASNLEAGGASNLNILGRALYSLCFQTGFAIIFCFGILATCPL